jgi:hypothetical protein
VVEPGQRPGRGVLAGHAAVSLGVAVSGLVRVLRMKSNSALR